MQKDKVTYKRENQISHLYLFNTKKHRQCPPVSEKKVMTQQLLYSSKLTFKNVTDLRRCALSLETVKNYQMTKI